MGDLKELFRKYEEVDDRLKEKEGAYKRLVKDLRTRVKERYKELLDTLPKGYRFDFYKVGSKIVVIYEGDIYLGQLTIDELSPDELMTLYDTYDKIVEAIKEDVKDKIKSKKKMIDSYVKEIAKIYEFLDGISNDY